MAAHDERRRVRGTADAVTKSPARSTRLNTGRLGHLRALLEEQELLREQKRLLEQRKQLLYRLAELENEKAFLDES